MYVGSVKFYKHMIFLVLAIIVIGSLASAIAFGIKYASLKSETSKLSNTYAELEKTTRFPYYTKSFDYQALYPNLYVKNDFKYEKEPQNAVYLTFDDGPSAITKEVLDILSERNIRATFFVIAKDGEETDAIYRRILADGHTLALHSTTHDYDSIYDSVDSFLTDIAVVSDRVENATGYKANLYRFPGGSVNPHNATIYRQCTAELLRRGYTYYDWNVSADDAVSGTTREQMVNNVVSGVLQHNKSIVLLHDSATKRSTLEVLPEILDTLTAEGYSFYPLTNKVRPITFDYEKAEFKIKE